MPSNRKQINVRVDDETESLMRGLLASVKAGLGMTVNQSDLFRLGLHELAKKYPPAAVAEQPSASTKPAAAKKRGRK